MTLIPSSSPSHPVRLTEGTGPAGSAPNAFFLVRRTLALPGPHLSPEEFRTAARNLAGVIQTRRVFYPGNRKQVASYLLTLVYWSGLFHGSVGIASPQLCDPQHRDL